MYDLHIFSIEKIIKNVLIEFRSKQVLNNKFRFGIRKITRGCTQTIPFYFTFFEFSFRFNELHIKKFGNQ